MNDHQAAAATPLPESRHSLELEGRPRDRSGSTSSSTNASSSKVIRAEHGHASLPQQANGIQEEAAAEPPEDGPSDGRHHEGRDDDVPDEQGGQRESLDVASRIAQLESELDRVTEERDTLQSQYRNLLGKLTNMRNTLGDKLRQDADELDRREQQIVNLQAANEDLQETVETLKSELIANNEETERLHGQVESLRLRANDSAKAILDEASARDAQLRDVTEDLERCRLEREDWENQAMKERVERESLETQLNAAERELAQLRTEKQQLKEERDREAESASNLHAVLEEFQAAKDRELKTTLGDMQLQLQSTTKSLQEYRSRAQAAETQLAATHSDSEKSLALQKEVKEKNLLIGKLRHEAVILNEHLTEALRRLRNDSAENNVDRRLVTNVLISFFNTPRSDSKRFEMLSLLASILSWSDEDRERAGLQRISTGSGVSAGASGSTGPPRPSISLGSSRRRATSRATSAFAGKGKGPADESFASLDGEGGLEQSFSNLWVEYLLREAQGGSPNEQPSNSTNTSPNLPFASPPLTTMTPTKTISPFAELPPPTSPTKGLAATTPGTVKKPPQASRQRSDTDTSESAFSRTTTGNSTAATSVVSSTDK